MLLLLVLLVRVESARGDGDGKGVVLVARASQGEGMRGDSLSVSPNIRSEWCVLYYIRVIMVDSLNCRG